MIRRTIDPGKARRADTRHSAAGFTVMELIVTMMAVGILAVFVAPRFDLLKGYDEIGYRDQVKTALQYARKAAVAQRRYVCVQRDGNTLRFSIDNDVPEGSGARSCPRALSLPGSNASQISPRGTVALTGASSLTFSPLGRPSAAATFTVRGDSDHVVAVEAETGYVH